MQFFGHRFKFLSVFVSLIVAMGVLSSCASKKKDYSSKTNPFPYNVVEVNVASLDPAGDEFARQLEFNLKQSVGSPAFAATRNVKLYVQTHPNGILDQSTKSLFRQFTSLGGASITASVRVMDSENGSSLRYEQITSSSTKDDIEIANLFIEEDLISQIRAILGLTIYPPRPISFVPTSVNTAPPADADLVFIPQQQVSDPLLNGQITPETKSTDVMQQIKANDEKMSFEAIQMKKKVNNEAKMVKEILMEDISEPESEPIMDKEMSMEKEADEVMMKPDDIVEDIAADDGELCIVTVENDCIGPNLTE